MSDKDSALTFQATVYKVQTLVDNGIRVTLDLSEDEIKAMASLAECQRWGAILIVTVEVADTHDDTRKPTKYF